MADPITVPRWAAHVTAGLAALATLAGIYVQYFREPEVLTLAAANAALAESVTEVPLALTPADRGADLPVERVREIAGDPVTYEIARYEPEAQRRRARQRRRRHKNETGS